MPKYGKLIAASLVRQGDDVLPVTVVLFDSFNNTLTTWCAAKPGVALNDQRTATMPSP